MTSAGAPVLDCVAALHCPYGFERSIKFASGRASADRFLTSFDKHALGFDPRDGLAHIAGRLGMPPEHLPGLTAALRNADLVHLGFEGGADPIFKLYLEFAGRVRHARAEPGSGAPLLVYLALKWSLKGRTALSRYFWTAGDDPLSRLAARGGDRGAPARMAAIRLAELARGRGELFLLEVEEEGSPRRSFDLNLYPAGLTIAEATPILADMVASFGLEPAEHLAPLAAETLGHLSGGVGSDGEAFATLYFGVEARDGRRD